MLDPDEDAGFYQSDNKTNIQKKQPKTNERKSTLLPHGNWLHKHIHLETTWCNLTTTDFKAKW